jgi:hypothetical protein
MRSRTCPPDTYSESVGSLFDFGKNFGLFTKAKARRGSAERAVGYQCAKHHDLVIRQGLVPLDKGHTPRDRNTRAGGKLPDFLPSETGENRMI